MKNNLFLAATIMQEDIIDRSILSKNPLTNILVTPTVRQMAKKLQVNKQNN